jgi:hypothetical protein
VVAFIWPQLYILTDICRSFLRVSKVTEKIKSRSKPTPSENFNSRLLCLCFVLYYVNLEQLRVYLKDMLAFVVYLK